MKKLKDRSPVSGLSKKISKIIGLKPTDYAIAALIQKMKAKYSDVQLDIQPLCLMVAMEARLSGFTLDEQFEVFEKEMSDLETA